MIKKSSKKSKKASSLSVLNFELQKIQPKTDNQQKVFDLYSEGKHLILYGSAGTGKSFLSLFLALNDMFENGTYQRIIIIRSAVASRNLGFLPGDAEMKLEQYETPYKCIINELFGRDDAYGILKQKDLIRFESTSFLRGLTYENCLIFVDECQNMNYGELHTICTRLNEDSRIIIAGDIKQCDLNLRKEISGMGDIITIVDNMKGDYFGKIEFNREDIVRSKFVKEFIIATENLGL